MKEHESQLEREPSCNLEEIEDLNIIPEVACPFQALSFSKKEPLSKTKVLEYLENESEAVSVFWYLLFSG